MTSQHLDLKIGNRLHVIHMFIQPVYVAKGKIFASSFGNNDF